MKKKSRLIDLAGLFLKLGAVGFGGPTALIALMETEMVQKRQWVTRDYFMDMLAAINLVPGPNAVEMAIYLGYLKAGLPGLLIGGICFLLPATLISLLLASYYQSFGSLPQIQTVLSILTPIIIAIIFTSGYRIGKSAIKNAQTIIICIGCFLAALNGINSITLILAGGLAGLVIYALSNHKITAGFVFGFNIRIAQDIILFFNQRIVQLTLYFLKVGATLFGGGFVLFAYVHNDLVSGFGWLSEKQLLDAIAVGQITPGPVSSAVTFIGYLIEGLPGAILATVAVFLPSFLIVLILGKILPTIRKSLIVHSILDGINAAVVALIFSVGLGLLKNTAFDFISLSIIALGIFLMLKYKFDPALLILGGIGLGIVRLFLF